MLNVFFSDTVEHEVMPSYKDRRALTFWISADYPAASTVKPVHIPDSPDLRYTNPINADLQKNVTVMSIKDHVKPLESSVKSLKATINATESDLNEGKIVKRKKGMNKRSNPLPDLSCFLPFSLPKGYWDKKTIFVSIASYCDSECGHTIRDLYRNAAVPVRIYVGVAWQGTVAGQWDWDKYDVHTTTSEKCNGGVLFNGHSYKKQSNDINRSPTNVDNVDNDDNGDDDDDNGWKDILKENVRTAAIPSDQACGPVWARGVAFALWRGEHYLLQIDSHLRFRQGWDRYLICQLEKTREEMKIMQKKERKELIFHKENFITVKKSSNFKNEDTLNQDIMNGNNCSNKSLEKRNRYIELKKHPKPVLTTYPLGYTLPNEIPNDTRATLLVD